MATAEQKRFFNALSKSGCVITGKSQVQIHHLEGRKFKFKKKLIGDWLVIPLAIELHDVSSGHPYNVTYHKNKFHDEYGTGYELLIKAIDNCGCSPPEEVLELAREFYSVNNDVTDWMSIL